MSLEFAIIPITEDYISVAYNIETKLKEIVNLEMIINIDTNYKQSLNSRVNKWKKQDFDIITIDQDYKESNSIFVRLYDKGSRPQIMEIDEFIELVSSFEETPETNNIKTSDKQTNDDSEQDGNCIIM